MRNNISLTPGHVRLTAGAALLATLAGCASQPPTYRTSSVVRHAPPPQTVVVYQDEYDYYPAYEVYYSRNRREYVYRDGRNWVRSPVPRGVPAHVLAASPAVRVDFRDSPERHHARIVQTYPRHWSPPNQRWGYRERSQVQHQGAVMSGEYYDYFPSYEMYYHPVRREYVYFDGRQWVRQPTPRGVAPNVLLRSPSVRLEFQDPPEQHHATIVRTYPRNWSPSNRRDDRDDRDDRRDRGPNDRRE